MTMANLRPSRLLPCLILSVAALSAPSSIGAAAPAARPLLLRNGHFWLGTHWGSTLWIENGRVIPARPGAHPVSKDLHGAYVIPGFIDGHMHPLFGAIFQQRGLALTDKQGNFLASATAVRDAVQRYLQAHPGGPAEWVTGYGWDPALATNPAFNRRLLDAVSGSRPVYLLSLDAHFALVNSAGLKRLGEIAFPAGSGVVPRDRSGRRTGLLLETPQFVATLRVLSEIPFAEKARAFERFQSQALEDGITSLCDLISDLPELRFYNRLLRQDRLKLRVYVSPYGPLHERRAMATYLRTRKVDSKWLALGPTKYLLDGTPGNHNAAWFQVYRDDPSTSGFLTLSPDHLDRIVADARRRGFDLALHAAGDLSVHEALDAIAQPSPAGSDPDVRLRVEHFDNVTREDRERLHVLVKRGLVASVQPTHFAAVYERRILEVIGPRRMRREYPLQTFIRAGVPLALNSDWPAALTFSPLLNLDAAEHHGAESLSPVEALNAATAGDAYALHSERWQGSLRPGYVADAVILSANPLQVRPRNLRVLATIVGGRVIAGRLP